MESHEKLKYFSAFREKLHRAITIVLGLPYHKSLHHDYCQAINRFEQLTMILGSCKYGFNSGNKLYRLKVDTQFHYMHCIIRISLFALAIRLILCLFSTNRMVHVFLADPFIDYKPSWPIYCFLLFTVISLSLLKEAYLRIESQGVLNQHLDVYNEIRRNRMSIVKLISENRVKIFYSVTIFCANFWHRLILLTIPTACFFSFVIYHESTELYRDSQYLWSTLFWFPSTLLSIISLVTFLMSIGGYQFITVNLILFRLRSIVVQIQTVRASGAPTAGITWEGFNDDTFVYKQIIAYLNKLDYLSKGYKSLIFGIILLPASISNFSVFAGIVVRSQSELLSSFLLAFGLSTFIGLTLVIYFCADIMNQLRKIHDQLHLLNRGIKLRVSSHFKINEIIARLQGPTNGIKIGDLATMTERFAVIFMAEFATSLLLQVCNFRPFTIEIYKHGFIPKC
ncbi:uncharacterized protein LOC107371415 isoform X2 [Tetranychus urticae]|uniref:Gustatory receptor n=1 Tax=Tetranychus urticae TaxID=32264 RepID=T1JUU6_TETUR|nr:uncharacterized protein LOC107371415 isoform X2 [Tetranychus urticae]